MIRATATFRPRSTAGQFIAAKVTPAGLASVAAAGSLIQQTAKGYCPVRTGALQESIQVTMVEGETTISARVAPTVDYADYVEFGTGVRGAASPGAGSGPYDPNWPGMVSQPYMRPAYDETKQTIADLFRSQLSSALRS